MRGRILFVVVALLATACGGGSAASSTTSEGHRPEFVFDPEVDQVTAFVVNELGEEPAAIAIFTAWELGYDAEQLLSIGRDGFELLASGTLERNGSAIEPAEARRGVIDLNPAGLHSLFGGSRPRPAEVLKGVDGCPDFTTYKFIELILTAAKLGVDPAPLVVGVALGTCPAFTSVTILDDDLDHHFCLYATLGDETTSPEFIIPSHGNAPECEAGILIKEGLSVTTTTQHQATTTTTSRPEDEEGTVYRGVAEFTLVARDTRDVFNPHPDNTCNTSPAAEMIVWPDGTLTLSVTWTEWVYQATRQEEGCRPVADIHGFGEFISVTEGTWSGTSFTASIQDPVHATASSAPPFTGEISGGFAVVQTTIEFTGVGVGAEFIDITLSMALPEVTG